MVGGDREVAAVPEVFLPEALPAREDPFSPHCAAENEHHGAVPVVSAAGAVLPDVVGQYGAAILQVNGVRPGDGCGDTEAQKDDRQTHSGAF